MGIAQIRESQLIHLICTKCAKQYNPAEIHSLCECGGVLFPQYDIEIAKETISSITGRRTDLWRFAELLPVYKPKYRLTLGEGNTPLINLSNIGKNYGCTSLLLKEEGLNPTGTFKSRGLCVAVSKGIELQITDFIIPTAGNAGVALAAYVARAGRNIQAYVYMPSDTPSFIQNEVRAYGGHLSLVNGLITDAGRIVKKIVEQKGFFDVSTLKEPYRVEGKKTMGIELLEQLHWEVPDVIIYPTGGGTGIVGMWKAFAELEQSGLINDKRPRMISVQSSSCAPIVKAFTEGKKSAELWENASTDALGLRVPKAIGDYLILKAIRESNGHAIAVSDDQIRNSMRDLAQQEGIFQSMEGAATLAAFIALIRDGIVHPDEQIVLFGTGSGFVYPEHWSP
jgi:threonine synthase